MAKLAPLSRFASSPGDDGLCFRAAFAGRPRGSAPLLRRCISAALSRFLKRALMGFKPESHRPRPRRCSCRPSCLWRAWRLLRRRPLAAGQCPGFRAPCFRSRRPARGSHAGIHASCHGLTDLLAVVGIPGTGLFQNLGIHAHVQNFTFARDAFAEQDVELGHLEGGETLFFTTLTLVSLPMASSPFLMVPVRRMSRRTEA